ncbi:MAG: TIGR04076 family protein [Candidatus Scalinduaceae bacterium]
MKKDIKRLTIKVKEIRGICPVYKPGEKIVIDEGYKLNMKGTDNICMHSLGSIFPYYVALSRGIAPTELGLARKGRRAYLQCLDPCEYTGGGTVIFEVVKG